MPTRRLPWGSAVAVLVVAGYTAAFAYSMEYKAYDMWGALIIFPLLLTLSVPLLQRLTVHDEPWLQRLVVYALVLKLLCSFARYWMSFVLYDGQADAAMYDKVGRFLADQFRAGDFDVDIGRKVVGTGFIMIVTGIVYTIVGQSLLGGYLVYSWLGFWGLYLFWRSFKIACPQFDTKRYAYLVFFLPSLLFWPSGIGKDTWMMFTLGLTAYGAALLLTRRRGAYLMLALGLVGSGFVRPHVAVIVMGGLVVAYLLRTRPDQVSALGPLRAGFGAVVIGAGCVLALKQVGKFFNTGDVSVNSANAVLAKTQTQTGQGGSAVTDAAAPSISPIRLPESLVTVLFRPFPFEAHNIQSLVASMEGVMLIGMVFFTWSRLKRLPKLLVKQPYVAFSIVYVILFALAFANIHNFGILTRERVQVFPFVLVLFALPKPSGSTGGKHHDAARDSGWKSRVPGRAAADARSDSRPR